MIYISLIVLIICAGLGFVAYNISNSALKSISDQSIEKVAQLAADSVNYKVNNYFSELNALAENELFHDIVGNKTAIINLL
jgi:hypothetical protein